MPFLTWMCFCFAGWTGIWRLDLGNCGGDCNQRGKWFLGICVLIMVVFRLLRCCPVSEGVRGRFAELASARADLLGWLIWFLVVLCESFFCSRPLGIISESTMTLASTFLSTPLALLGWRVKPVGRSKAKKVCFNLQFDFLLFI